MRLWVLASGSRGNAALVEAGPTRLLVDAGLSVTALDRRLAEARLGAGSVDALLVTHEHGDHGAAARAVAARGVPLLATAGTARALGLSGAARPFGAAAGVGEVAVTAVPLPHDAAEPVGLVLSHAGVRVGVLTDCGHDAPAVCDAFGGCDVLLLEANHDAAMLEAGPYPTFLKRRIASDEGHLSNDQAARIVARLAARGGLPRVLVLGHLSDANNRPALALGAIGAALDRAGARAEVDLRVARQRIGLAPIDVAPRSAGAPEPRLTLPVGA